jgi:hypothetical protein
MCTKETPFATLEFGSHSDAEKMISHLWRDETLQDVKYDVGPKMGLLLVHLSPGVEARLRETGIQFRILATI